MTRPALTLLALLAPHQLPPAPPDHHEFAETVSALSGLPLARTVLEFTNLY